MEVKRDRPENDGAHQIDVTPEMVDAAMEVLHSSGYLENPSQSDSVLVKDMLSAALAASSLLGRTQDRGESRRIAP